MPTTPNDFTKNTKMEGCCQKGMLDMLANASGIQWRKATNSGMDNMIAAKNILPINKKAPLI